MCENMAKKKKRRKGPRTQEETPGPKIVQLSRNPILVCRKREESSFPSYQGLA